MCWSTVVITAYINSCILDLRISLASGGFCDASAPDRARGSGYSQHVSYLAPYPDYGIELLPLGHPAAVPYTILKSEGSLPTSIFTPSLSCSDLNCWSVSRSCPVSDCAESKRPPRQGSQLRCYFRNPLKVRCGDGSKINGPVLIRSVFPDPNRLAAGNSLRRAPLARALTKSPAAHHTNPTRHVPARCRIRSYTPSQLLSFTNPTCPSPYRLLPPPLFKRARRDPRRSTSQHNTAPHCLHRSAAELNTRPQSTEIDR
jgi:hypothetical protein